MIVKLRANGKVIRIDGSNLEPPEVGDFLARALDRVNLNQATVARKSGLGEKLLSDVLENKVPISRSIARKLQSILPNTYPVLMRMHLSKEFHRRYGIWRPIDPRKRRLIVRQYRHDNLETEYT